jgi:Flp pilus assembly protein CpaB
MQPSRVPFVLALVTFALALVSGAYLYHQVIRSVPALVAVRDIPAGSPILPAMVDVVRVPAGGTPPGALWGKGQVTGKYAAVPLYEGHILSGRQLADTATVVDAVTPEPGQRVVSVPVKPEAVLGGALKPGDIVDVAAAWSAADAPAQGQTGRAGPVEVLVHSVRVVDLRNNLGQPITVSADSALPDGAVPSSVLLQVSTTQAGALVEAVESRATLYLWLVRREPS